MLLFTTMLGCQQPVDDSGQRPMPYLVGDPVQVVPSDGLPVTPQDANNNLSVTDFDGRTFLAWRTAPDHFASTEAQNSTCSQISTPVRLK